MDTSKVQLLLLTDIEPSKKCGTICVRISRMWEYYNRDQKLAHVDLVLIDEMGNKMYAEISAAHAPKLMEVIKEDHVYLIRDFLVQPAKNMYKPVDGVFMIKLTSWTKIEEATTVADSFPRYAYSLTSFDELPKFIGRKEKFIDTIGVITAVSDLLHVQLPAQYSASLKRNLQLMDIHGKTVDVALWGDHASNFAADQVYKDGQSQLVIILFVGTLVKDYRGHDTISCGEAAKYYINPDIPETHAYCDRFGQQIPLVRWMAAGDDRYQKTYRQSEPDEVDIKTVLSRDPYDLLGKNMVSTITIMKMLSNSWWFLACSKCHKTAYPVGTEFACSDKKCLCVAAGPRYRISLIGNDGTADAQFVLFAGVAEQVIGKSVDAVQRASARRPGTMPAEIASLVSRKLTVNFSVAERSLEFGELTFQVNRVNIIHPNCNSFQFAALASGSGQADSAGTPSPTLQFLPSQIQVASHLPTSSSVEEINKLDGNDAIDASCADHLTGKSAVISNASSPAPSITTPPAVLDQASVSKPDTSSAIKKDGNKRTLGDIKNTSVSRKLFKED